MARDAVADRPAAPAWPGERWGRFISKAPGVMGGSACIRNARVSVWILAEARAAGATEASLLQDDPGLIRANLDAAWDYFAQTRAEIIDVILENRLA